MEASCVSKKIRIYMGKQTRIRIVVTGGKGFIGSNFLRYIKKEKNIEVTALDHKTLDLLDRKKLDEIFKKVRPHIVVNFAAHRNANTAETQRGDKKGSAWQTNVVGLKNIFRLCRTNKTYIIHISTDMVFTGRKDNKGPYKEREKPATKLRYLSWYGWTKAEGERVLWGQKNAAIVRIGNVTKPIYDPKLDYAGKIIYLFDRKALYPLFDDQYLTLTSILHLFKIIDILIKTKRSGVFHATSTNTFTPFELGTYLLNKFRRKAAVAKRISIDTYLQESPNRYPKYGGLTGKLTENILHIRSMSWQRIVSSFNTADLKSH